MGDAKDALLRVRLRPVAHGFCQMGDRGGELPEPQAIISLRRYWVWADFQKKVMLDLGEAPEPETDVERVGRHFDAAAALSFFYAALYVVAEGCAELRMSDPEVDGLLASENLALLRRFRNGVFHYQRDYDDARFLGFLDEAEDAVEWARSLHKAFADWFQRWAVTTFGYGPREMSEWLRAQGIQPR